MTKNTFVAEVTFKQTCCFSLQVSLSNMYGLLSPPDIKGLKLLFIMPGGKKGHVYLSKATTKCCWFVYVICMAFCYHQTLKG